VKWPTARLGIETILVASVVACDPSASPEIPSLVERDSEASSIVAKVDPSIAADVQAGRPRQVLVVLAEHALRFRRVQFAAKIPDREFDSYRQAVKLDLDALKNRVLTAAGPGATNLRVYDNLPIMAVRIDSPSALADLAAQPQVVALVDDHPLYASDTAPAHLDLVGQPAVVAAGNVGANTAVAVLDSGTDFTRAPFNCTAPGEPAGCPVIYAKDFATEDNVRDSGNHHGTNVSGIVLAVAPATKILALDVFEKDVAYASAILSAIDWCVENKSKYNIVAINLSLGSGLYGSPCPETVFAPAVAAARAAGILTTAASGNDGSSSGISTPACVPGVVSVGAVYDHNAGAFATGVCSDPTTAADKIACFSNSNSFLTVLAPGVGINAAGTTLSGTSQASPHVAGAIALLASALPEGTPDDWVARLTTSRTKITDGRNKVTKPRLDLPAALGLAVAGTEGASGPSAPAPSGLVVINKGEATTRSPVVTVNVTTTSGIATQVCLSDTIACSSWQTYSPTVSFTLSAGDGRKTVYAWWKNSAGGIGESAASASIVLDTTAPENGVIGIAIASGVATLAWSGFSDEGSGLASTTLVTSTSALADCSRGTLLYSGPERSFKTAKLPTGVTYFRVCASDSAGNVSTGVPASVKVTGS
jgi:hypothetical protein